METKDNDPFLQRQQERSRLLERARASFPTHFQKIDALKKLKLDSLVESRVENLETSLAQLIISTVLTESDREDLLREWDNEYESIRSQWKITE